MKPRLTICLTIVWLLGYALIGALPISGQGDESFYSRVMANGQRPSSEKCLPIKVRNPDGNYIVPGVMGDIVYRRAGGVELSLDAYVQKRGARRPAVVVVHGGVWTSGSRIAFVGQFLEMLTRAGYNWFSVDYRLGGLARHAEAARDIRAAVEFIRCHAREFRIDPDNIALLGEDAGAHLALMLAQASERPAGIKAVVSIGGFYDLRESPNLKSQASSTESQISNLKSHISDELLALASPITKNLKDALPVLVIQGGDDRESPPQQAGRYCEAMRAAGRFCEYVAVDGAIHRPENWLPSQWGYKGLVTAWLGKELGLRRADHEPYVTSLRKDLVYDARRNLKFDAWTPPGKGPHPAVIIAHGGGWEAGDKVTYVTPLFEPLAKAGFAWFSIDYRLTPQFRNADQLEDFREAIRFIRSNAARFNVDPDRLAILGESASGQLVIQLAAEKVEGVAAAVSFYGVYDFLPMATSFAPRSIPSRLFGLTEMNDEARTVMKRFSPLYQVKTGMPPLLLVQGTADRLHEQAVALEKELDRVGASYDIYDVDGAPHGVENWEGHAVWLGYKQKLVEWLKDRLSTRK